MRTNGSQFVLHEHFSPPECGRLADITRAGNQELPIGTRPQASAQIVHGATFRPPISRHPCGSPRVLKSTAGYK